MSTIKKCHNLKPFGLADFTESAVLQGACGRRLQLRTLRLASSTNSTITQFRFLYVIKKNHDRQTLMTILKNKQICLFFLYLIKCYCYPN